MRIPALALSVALAVACGVLQAQTYRWVDKDGKVRYGDTPPPGAKATALKPPAGGTPSAAPAAADGKAEKKGPLTPAEQEKAYRERQSKATEARQKEEKAQAQAEQRKENCASAQESVRSMESGRRISKVDAKGETVYMDDKEVQERLAKAREAASAACK